VRRRVIAALVGTATSSAVLAAALVSSPWRPTGVLLLVALLGLVLPATAAAGTALAMRVVGTDAIGQAARLTALGTPFSVLLVLFSIHVVLVNDGLGGQQVAALVVGSMLAGGMAARFTGADAEADEPA
jgi:hypothetical protein